MLYLIHLRNVYKFMEIFVDGDKICLVNNKLQMNFIFTVLDSELVLSAYVTTRIRL